MLRKQITQKQKITSEMKPTYYLKNLLMTSNFDSHSTTDYKPEMLSGAETGNRIPHDE